MKKLIIAILAFICMQTNAYAYVYFMELSTSPQIIEFYLQDPAGNKTGYIVNSVIEQIPNSGYGKTTAITEPESPTEEDKFNILSISKQVVTGKYNIILYGSILPTPTRITIRNGWSDNNSGHGRFWEYKLIYPNVIWSYEFDVGATPPPNGQIILTKISTPADLIKDITIAGQLGYIGNPHFVSDIVEKINEIEKERAKPAEKDDKLTPAQKAKKEYQELLGEITEKYNKPEADEYIKKEAYDVLKEDIEYIIGHL